MVVMKLMIASDIHGSGFYTERMIERYQEEGAEKLLLLGDILYHGPRNDLPCGYDPKKVASLLNKMKEKILCVRGNCEAEVDQMVLEFPVLADYAVLWLEGRMVFATHGHHYNAEALPPFEQGSILLNGHTHLMAMEERDGYLYMNPGSISLPKGGNPNSYMVFVDGVFYLKDMNGVVLQHYTLSK